MRMVAPPLSKNRLEQLLAGARPQTRQEPELETGGSLQLSGRAISEETPAASDVRSSSGQGKSPRLLITERTIIS